MTASIIANSASSWFQSCLLDKGSADGVRKGMAVVTPLGVVGKVVSVTGRTRQGAFAHRSQQRYRRHCPAHAQPRHRFRFARKRHGAEIHETQRRRSGRRSADHFRFGWCFPKGLMVGTVIKVRKQNLGLFQSVEVLPAVHAARIEEVLVVSCGNRSGEKVVGRFANLDDAPMKLFLLFFLAGIFLVVLQTTLFHLLPIGPVVPDLDSCPVRLLGPLSSDGRRGVRIISSWVTPSISFQARSWASMPLPCRWCF